jgi:Cu-processing system ATP-binding protein
LHLKKSFGKNDVLNDISLSVNKGSITAVMGPNGSGKTTLIKCILGLVRQDIGSIKVNGLDTLKNNEYRKFIGYMPQVPRYPENLRISELIKMFKDVRGNDCIYDEELLNRLNITGFYGKPFGTLSSGSKQRVSGAIAFLFGQEVIILDEPTAGLDPVSSEIMKNKIRKEKENGKLILLTSHIVSEVEMLADRVIFLLEGSVQADGSVDELKKLTGEGNLNRSLAKIIENCGQ